MRLNITPLALPMAFWACGSSVTSTPPPAGRDATARPDASGFADAETFADAMAARDAELPDAPFDAGMFMPDATAAEDSGPAPCAYPADAVEPMALDRALSPYSWPAAIDGMNTNVPLDLRQVFCNNDPNRDWAGTDVLLFVTAPAW